MAEKQPERGKCVRVFRMSCGVCQQTEEQTYEDGAGNYDAAIERFCSRAWRVTEQWGYVHKKCVPLAPINLKFQ